MTEQNERLARVETQLENQQKEISRLVSLQATMVDFLAAQRERNRLTEEALKTKHNDQHDERWQVWLRWMFNPGIPIGLLLAIYMQISGGMQP